jgi:hypothetical protein
MMNNKLIADFMQLRFENNQYYTPTHNSGEWLTESELQYHTSWDWLMPVVQKCFYGTPVQVEDNQDNFFYIKNSLPDMDATYKAVVEFIEGLSVEADTKAVDDAFYLGFCHALEYVKREIENVEEVEVEVEQDSGNLTISGTINIDLGQHLDADNMIDDIMRKYERDTPKDGSNV